MSALLEPRPSAAAGTLSHCPRCGSGKAAEWFPAQGVCVPCRTQEARNRAMATDCDQLAHTIALLDALGRIRRMALVTGDGWFDPNFALMVAGRESAALEDAIRYLDLRGCIEKHPAYHGLFRLRPSHGQETGRG